MTDPIADMIVRMKNAAMAGKEVVSMPHSTLKRAIADKLKERGVVLEAENRGKNTDKTLELVLAKSDDGRYRFTDVKRVSKPGCRVYTGAKDIKPVRGGMGFLVVSTPKGILFGDEAKKQHVGGEVLFEIW
jgi:small subunit ribosomal protein S8